MNPLGFLVGVLLGIVLIQTSMMVIDLVRAIRLRRAKNLTERALREQIRESLDAWRWGA
jgi:hypothetical protein